MLTDDDWKMIVEAARERTASFDLDWVVTEDGPARTLSFGASIDDATTLSIWGYTTSYSYQLQLTKTGPEGILFQDAKRATSKKNAGDIDFSGLFKAIREHMTQKERRAVEANRDAAFSLIRGYVENPPECEGDVGRIALAARLVQMDPDPFTVKQWLQFVDVLKGATEARAIEWTREEEVDETFSATVGELRVELSGSRSSDSEPFTFYLDILASGGGDVGPAFGAETDDERLDGKNRQYPAYRSLKGLFEQVSAPFEQQKAQFQQIVKDDIVHGVLASLGASSRTSSPDMQSR